ncbi:hypothetical protein [Ponticaulis sp.]|jgi:hypothetical protein|uniref:hypothetical protein n=1 Tax=Ponticaulis sp. TaxID=2020902 RepID=UPI000C5BBCEC|nr:hypothetical protein [Ponticaulis sp.]MAF57829.1 hypothetical protein [Ponticaulis sp.]MBN04504.1 hypothetical protein [Ponticaulis sp.]|tara:strand:+ start:186 stop:380 length:195 start_codon:yes stop_codon:yes gene_type:complete
MSDTTMNTYRAIPNNYEREKTRQQFALAVRDMLRLWGASETSEQFAMNYEAGCKLLRGQGMLDE